MSEMIEWTVKIRVSDTWVADGYEVDAWDVKSALLKHNLGDAYWDEVEIEVVKSPSPDVIKDLQTVGPYDERENKETDDEETD